MRRYINIFLTVLILLGVGVLAFGGYKYFDMKSKEKLMSEQVDELLRNRVEIEVTDDDPSGIKAMLDEKKNFMSSDFGHGDGIGKLLIPKIDGELSIVEGVHEDDLLKGVGHDQDTLFPTDDGQIVLSGHRDTVFTGMGELEIGDTMTISMPYGDFEYKIVEMYITDPDDLTVIVPHDEETLTVTTCYPFNYVGHAPNRYIVNAEPMFDMDEFRALQNAYGI